VSKEAKMEMAPYSRRSVWTSRVGDMSYMIALCLSAKVIITEEKPTIFGFTWVLKFNVLTNEVSGVQIS